MSFDWLGWYGAYENADSSLSRRLRVVRHRIAEVLDAAGGPIRILSLCSGDGRDLLPELAARPNLLASAVLVELNPTLAGRAAEAADHLTVQSDRACTLPRSTIPTSRRKSICSTPTWRNSNLNADRSPTLNELPR